MVQSCPSLFMQGILQSGEQPGLLWTMLLWRTCFSLVSMLDQWAFSDIDAGGQPPRKGGEQEKDSIKCVSLYFLHSTRNTVSNLRITVTDHYWTYSDHLTRYINVKSLCCIPEPYIVLNVNNNKSLKIH